MTIGALSAGNVLSLAPSQAVSAGGVLSGRPVSTTAASSLCYIDQQQQPFEPLKMMQAIHVENFGGPDVLQLKANLIVPPLTKTQVLVRVKCAGVNPVETYIREGQYSRFE